MGFGIKLLLLALVITNLSSDAKAQDMFGLVTASICTLTTGASSALKCSNEFKDSIKPFVQENGKVPEVVMCCAITTLRYCIVDKIGKECGSNIESLINGIIDTAVSSFKTESSTTCKGNEIYYRKESPVCWAVWGHVLGAVGLGILLLTVCCCCCKCCCGKSRKSNPAPVVVTLFSNPEGRTHSSGSNVPYKQLTEASAA